MLESEVGSSPNAWQSKDRSKFSPVYFEDGVLCSATKLPARLPACLGGLCVDPVFVTLAVLWTCFSPCYGNETDLFALAPFVKLCTKSRSARWQKTSSRARLTNLIFLYTSPRGVDLTMSCGFCPSCSSIASMRSLSSRMSQISLFFETKKRHRYAAEGISSVLNRCKQQT